MVIGIFGILFLVLAVVAAIYYINEGDDEALGLIGFFLVSSIFFVFISICVTHYVKLETDYERQEYLVTERQNTLAKIDEYHMTYEMLDAIQKYNDKVNIHNNRVIKWKLEDRSRFEIDYNYYRKLFDEQMQAKINEGLGG